MNSTCSISNTPILNDQKVRIFFLSTTRGKYQQQSSKFSNVKSNNIFHNYYQYVVLGGIGLKAVRSEEVGYVFDHNSFEAKHVLDIIKEFYYTIPKEEMKDSLANEKSVDIKNKDLNFKKVMSLISHDDLYLKSCMRNDVLDSVSIMAVHEDVYQMILSDSQEIYTLNDGYIKNTFEYNMKVQTEKFLKWKEDIEKSMKRMKIAITDITDENAIRCAYGINKFGEDYESTYSFMSRDPISTMLMKRIIQSDKLSEKEVFEIGVENKYFVKILESYNIMLRPTMDSGDNSDYSAFRSLYKNLNKVIHEIEKREEE